MGFCPRKLRECTADRPILKGQASSGLMGAWQPTRRGAVTWGGGGYCALSESMYTPEDL